MPKQYLTAQDQLLWSQRIEKEAINARSQAKFSVRSAINVPLVPQNFKPGHVDPSKQSRSTSFDPVQQFGWDPQGVEVKEFRRSINMQNAGPRERHQFPETMQQEHGWALSRAGVAQERSAPSGSNPSKLGIGWLQNDGHGFLQAGSNSAGQRPSAPASSHGSGGGGLQTLPQEPPAPAPRRPRIGVSVCESLGAPPFGTSVPTARFSCLDGSSLSSGGTPPRSVSTPALVDKAQQLTQQDASVGNAMDRSRNFLNRHNKNQWYHPLSNSDVATFADNYSKCWGKQLYGKAK